MKYAICDDMKRFRDTLRGKIEQYSTKDGQIPEIEEYSSGEELLEVFSPDKYDAIFLDYEMKELNGLQTAQEIRRVDKNVQIIFHTGYNSLDTTGYDLGIYEFIVKGSSDDIYSRKLSEIYDRCKLGNEVFSSDKMNIKVKHIIYFHQRLFKTIMVTDSGEVEIKGKISNIDIPKFVRASKSYLINPLHIIVDMKQVVILDNKQEIQIK